MLGLGKRVTPGDRWSQALARAIADLKQAKALYERALSRLAGHQDAQEDLKPELEAISAAVRDVELRTTRQETLEDLLVAARYTSEWAARLNEAAGRVLSVHKGEPASSLRQIQEIQKAIPELLTLLKKWGLAAPDL